MSKTPQKAEKKAGRYVYLRERMERYAFIMDVAVGWPLAIIQWVRGILWVFVRVAKKLVD